MTTNTDKQGHKTSGNIMAHALGMHCMVSHAEIKYRTSGRGERAVQRKNACANTGLVEHKSVFNSNISTNPSNKLNQAKELSLRTSLHSLSFESSPGLG